MSSIPAYIQRSIAGSYDNEAVAIFALVNTFHLWVKAINTGSILWSCACTLAYVYMVVAWGGYTFLINLIPIFVLGTMFIMKFNMRIYVTYGIFYTIGCLLSLPIPFVGHQVMGSSEHLLSHFTFFMMQLYVVLMYLRSNLKAEVIQSLTRLIMLFFVTVFLVLILALMLSGKTKLAGRTQSLLDPSWAKKYNPLIASVSEHKPTSWPHFFFDCGFTLFLMPVGLYYCLVEKVTMGKFFLAMYGVTSAYFAGLMTRLILVFAPAVCILAAIGVAENWRDAAKSIRVYLTEGCESSGAAVL